MRTFRRICIKDYEVADEDGNVAKIERGREYITSAVNDAPKILNQELIAGHVIVFADYWFPVPVEYFAGEIQFT